MLDRNLFHFPKQTFRFPKKLFLQEQRPQSGMFLVEAIIACLMAAVVSTALIGSYTGLNRVSVGTQMNLTATTIANEVIDHLRFLPFTLIQQATPSTRYLMVNDTTSGAGPWDSGSPVLFQHPLLRNGALNYYNQSGVDDTSVFNAFSAGGKNTVEVDLVQGASSTQINAIVTVKWQDSTGVHTYKAQTILANAGLNG